MRVPGPLAKIRRLRAAGTLGLAMRGEIGDWVSRLGERIGSEALTYNAWTYDGFHRAALETAPAMVAGIRGLFPGVRSVVDFGCGTGVYVSEWRRLGLDALGFEYSERARRIAKERMGVEVEAFDLEVFAGAGRGFDLSTSFEVAEHLPPDVGERLVDVCCRSAPVVVFSAAHPGQPGQGHIHLRPKAFWIERFAARGFRFEDGATSRLEAELRRSLSRGLWLADNVAVFERVSPGAAARE